MTQLLASKSCIRELFKVLLADMNGFKYQITLHVTLKKNKSYDKFEYAGIYLNSFVKLVINDDFEGVSTSALKKYYTDLIIGLMKDLDGLLK